MFRDQIFSLTILLFFDEKSNAFDEPKNKQLRMKGYLCTGIIAIGLLSCGLNKSLTKQLANEPFQQALADTLLAYALDHEALYTLADTLKPVSSVKFLRYSIAKDSTQHDGDITIATRDSLLKKIRDYQQVCHMLSEGDWQFVLTPFNRTEKNIRNMEIYVVRKSVFAKKIRQHQHFFGQWGFTPNASPAVVLSVIEYETKLDRNRAFGYLFGYPPHAVDFFVEAAKVQNADTSKPLVKRDFFSIPVFAKATGYFTYAVPKGYKATPVDSTIYKAATQTLQRYKVARAKFSQTKNVDALKLWRYLIDKN
jgi:hypothetical protein